MGGPGSGRWHGHSTRQTVEDCLLLDVRKLVRDGLLYRPTVSVRRSLVWRNTRTGEEASSISYALVEPVGESGLIIRLVYSVGRDDDRQSVDLPVRLQTTPQPYGGFLWWFTCPLVIDGIPCRRRAAKLYLPPGGRYFGCRACYNLTYTSCNESHRPGIEYQIMALYRRLDRLRNRDRKGNRFI